MPKGIPRYVRIYDKGEDQIDRYTVVYTGRYRNTIPCQVQSPFLYTGMSVNPYHPQGVGHHGESDSLIDRPTYAHLGKPIAFADLPIRCRDLVRWDYCTIWKLKKPRRESLQTEHAQ